MALGLGNNLIRNGGAGNPDKLSLDLQFAADKTLTARKGPTPVFVRGSGATQVGASGLIEYAPENLILRSQESSFWGITGSASKISTDSAVAPDGTMTADVVGFSGASGYLTSTVTSVASPVPVTISCWVRVASETALFRLQIVDSPSPNFTATTTWQRFSHTGSLTSSYSGIRAASDGSSSTLEVWGLQVERSSTARTYIPTTTAAVYGARFDHDPVTLACKGLLIEESRENKMIRSEEFDNSGWVKIRASVDDNATTDPAGTLNADKLIEDSSTGTHMTYRSTILSSLVPHTFSVYAKAGGRNFMYLQCGDGFPVNCYAYFDLSTGIKGTVGANATANIEPAGNGWYRCSVTATPSSLTTNIFYIQPTAVNGSISYAGDGTSGLYVWGAQVEAGSFPTSYIPTTTGPLARSADVCTITGADFNTVYNQSEVSIFSEFEFQASNASAIVHCNNGSSNEVVALTQFSSPSRLAIFVVDGGVTQAAVNANANINQVYKSAISAKLNSFQFVLNGVLGTKDTSGTMPTPTQINIGKTQSAVHLNGNIKQIKIFRKELSDAKLQALTT